MRYAMAMLLGLSFGASHVLHAQSALRSGQRVRITSSHYRLDSEVGHVISSTTDSLIVQLDRVRTEQTLALSLAALDRVDVSRGTRHRTQRGALIGLGVGAAVGLVVGFATYEECNPIPERPLSDLVCFMAPTSAAEQGVLGAATVGFIGAGIGAIVGSVIRWDKWEQIPAPIGGCRCGR